MGAFMDVKLTAAVTDRRDPGVHMHMSTRARRVATVTVAALLAGCGDMLGLNDRLVVLDVAPYTVECQGVGGPSMCLEVRDHPEGEWRRLYGSIRGFDFEEGFQYTLHVAIRTIHNPPPDAPGRDYRLLAVLRKEPAIVFARQEESRASALIR
jgi:hypothetical protein